MTIEKIVMPQLGESVTEGTIERWLVKPGDYVKKYDPIAEVVSDKVNAEIPSSFSGTIQELMVNEGETYPVGTVLCTVNVEEQSSPKSHISEAIKNAGKTPVEVKVSVKGTGEFVPKQKSRYSPAVLKLASEHNLDLEKITGTGLNGRITRKDVLNYIEKQTKEVPTTTPEPLVSENIPQTLPMKEAAVEISTNTGDKVIPISGLRRTIANNMVRSKHEIPHAWMMVEVDVTNLVKFRNKIKEQFKEREGYNITYFAFFIKAVAQALKEFPMLNSVWAGDKIIQKKEINISIAVATDDALFVPVIKNADEKSVKGIAQDP